MRRKSFAGMDCPVAAAMEAIGDAWGVLILRDILFGKRQFDVLQESLGIASDTLSRRLKSLEADGLLTKTPYQERPTRYEYKLSPKGRDLTKLLLAMAEWGAKWEHEEGRPVNWRAVHRVTGAPVSIQIVDSGGAIVSDRDVRVLGVLPS